MTTKSDKDEDFQSFLSWLVNPEPRKRVISLQTNFNSAEGNRRILPYLEAALKDCEVTVLMIPYAYGEVRIAAAYALQAERQALGITEPVVLKQVPRPLNGATGFNIPMLQARENPEAMQALQQAEKLHPGGHPALIARYKVLREYNLIPLFDLELKTTPEVKYLFVAGTPL